MEIRTRKCKGKNEDEKREKKYDEETAHGQNIQTGKKEKTGPNIRTKKKNGGKDHEKQPQKIWIYHNNENKG